MAGGGNRALSRLNSPQILDPDQGSWTRSSG